MTRSIPAFGALMLTGGLAAAQSATPTGTSGTYRTPVRVELKNAGGRTIGDAQLRETPHGVLLKVDLKNADPGTHAFHIHETGRCEGPTFESAGGHFAPGESGHGFLDDPRPHAGDLPNVHVPEDGKLSIEFLVEDVTLGSASHSLLDRDGSALVMHAKADDYRTDPAGAAGDRIACGVITGQGSARTGEPKH